MISSCFQGGKVVVFRILLAVESSILPVGGIPFARILPFGACPPAKNRLKCNHTFVLDIIARKKRGVQIILQGVVSMPYRIITDSCCDFPQPMYEEQNLSVVNLTVSFRGQDTNTYTEDWLKDMFNGLRAGEAAQTSAVNPEGWKVAMEPALAAGQDVLVLAFSSGLSTTYQSAVIAAQELKERYPDRKIYVVDTLCASLGQGLFVWYACKHRDAGMSLEELTDWCENNKLNLAHWFTVDDLMFLKRGGRVSATTALVGTMLQIKPVMHVDNDGHLIKVGTARGRKASINALINKFAETALPGENDTVFICHGDCMEDAQYVAQKLKNEHGVKEVFIYYVGAVIGSHSGPGTLALFFLGSQR